MNKSTPYTMLDGLFDAAAVAITAGICSIQYLAVTCPDDMPTFIEPQMQNALKTFASLDMAYFVARGIQITFFNGPSPLHRSSKPKGPSNG